MGFTKHTQVKAGSRAEYVKSIVDQLQEADGDIVLWQQELCEQASIPVPGVYAPVMTALEYLGLVDRYTGDEDEGLGKANTGYAWVQDTVEIKDISSKRERRPGQTQQEYEDGDEPSRRKKTTGKVTAKRSRVIEPEEDEIEDEIEEEEETPRRSRRSRNSKTRSRQEVEPEEDDIEEEEEEEEVPRSRRSSRTSSSASSRSTNRRSSRSESVDEEDEEDEAEEAPKSRRRPLRSKAAVEEPEEESKPRARPRRRAAA